MTNVLPPCAACVNPGLNSSGRSDPNYRASDKRGQWHKRIAATKVVSDPAMLKAADKESNILSVGSLFTISARTSGLRVHHTVCWQPYGVLGEPPPLTAEQTIVDTNRCYGRIQFVHVIFVANVPRFRGKGSNQPSETPIDGSAQALSKTRVIIDAAIALRRGAYQKPKVRVTNGRCEAGLLLRRPWVSSPDHRQLCQLEGRGPSLKARGGPGRSPTCDLRLRSAPLYATELPGHSG